MAKDKIFKVPEWERKEFYMLVQKANRRVKSALNFIEKEGITSESTKRALVHDYASPSAWAGSKQVFSRSVKFPTEKDYQRVKRHLEEWAGDDAKRSIDNIRDGYYKAIIQALTTTALDNGNGVLTKTGRLPGNLAKQIKSLTLEQLTNFFDHGDPTESIETQGWSSDEYIGVDRDEFVDITRSHIETLKRLFPGEENNDIRVYKNIKKKRKAKARKSKARKSKSRKKRKK